MGGFVFLMLRPFLAEIINETRRIAELLSQLPAEVRQCRVVCLCRDAEVRGLQMRRLHQAATYHAVKCINFACPLCVQMDVDTMLAKTLLADMGLVGAAQQQQQQQQGKGGLTADGLKEAAAAEKSKGQSSSMAKSRSMG
jgi:hypothetical protein